MIGITSSSTGCSHVLPHKENPVLLGVGVGVLVVVKDGIEADSEGIGAKALPTGEIVGDGVFEIGELEAVFVCVDVGVIVELLELVGLTVPEGDGVGVNVDDSVDVGVVVLVIVLVVVDEMDCVGVGVKVGDDVPVCVGVTDGVPVCVLV